MRVTVVRSRRKQLVAALRELASKTVTVGVHGDAAPVVDDDGKPTGFRMADLAAVHEFGSGHIPERSFLRAAVAEHGESIAANVRDELGKMIERDAIDAKKLLTRGGVLLVGAVRETISNRIPPPLAESTKRQRDRKAAHGGGLAANVGSYTPLVDTGQLWQSIVFEIQDQPKVT